MGRGKGWSRSEDLLLKGIMLYHLERGHSRTQAYKDLEKFIPGRTRMALYSRFVDIAKEEPQDELIRLRKENKELHDFRNGIIHYVEKHKPSPKDEQIDFF